MCIYTHKHTCIHLQDSTQELVFDEVKNFVQVCKCSKVVGNCELGVSVQLCQTDSHPCRAPTAPPPDLPPLPSPANAPPPSSPAQRALLCIHIVCRTVT